MIYDCIIKNNKQYPDKTAIIVYNNRYSYSLLYNDIIKCANYLIQNKVEGKKVGILIDSSYEAIVAIYACSMIDVLVVPLNPNLMVYKLNELIKEFNIQNLLTSEAKLLFTNKVNCDNVLNIDL